MTRIIALFDVDDTLVKTSTIHRSAFQKAIKETYDVEATNYDFDYRSCTDQQIIYNILLSKGIGHMVIEAKLPQCMKKMVEVFSQIIASEQIIVLTGVRELLSHLKEAGVLLGLVTGNLEEIARGKLSMVGLNDYFAFGGFGSDDKDRVYLVNLAMQRAKELYSLIACNVFVIGDTPMDVFAAKQNNCVAIGVATGKHSEQELCQEGADRSCRNIMQVADFILST